MLKHFKRWCNFEISFWFFKVIFKRWCNTFWIIFRLVAFKCRIIPEYLDLNMFRLVWWCNFEIFYLALLQKMVQYKPFRTCLNLFRLAERGCNFKISIWYSCKRWCNIKYLYLDLSQSISILIYPNLYLSWSILIYLDLSWSILIYLDIS